jgi:hypothetical protein
LPFNHKKREREEDEGEEKIKEGKGISFFLFCDFVFSRTFGCDWCVDLMMI